MNKARRNPINIAAAHGILILYTVIALFPVFVILVNSFKSRRAIFRVPALSDAGIKRIVNGAISFSPDARPMIGPLPGVPNFFVACGFLGGIAQAGGIGLAMSQWIMQGEPEFDLSFIDVARFGDWTSREFARERTYEVFPRRYEIIYPHAERETGRQLRTTPIRDSRPR